MNSFILYAPNIHTGGGLILLRTLLENCPQGYPLIAFLDERARNKVEPPRSIDITWVKPSFKSRIIAESLLLKAANQETEILCFHGLPPLLNCKTKVSVFLQNRLLIQRSLPARFKLKTRIRIYVERWLSRKCKHRVKRYIVQTPSMLREVEAWLGNATPAPIVQVIPFVASLPTYRNSDESAKTWDFAYVADGEAHKNHLSLLAAWQLLAKEGIRPSLALTLGQRDVTLLQLITEVSTIDDLSITNLGHLAHQDIIDLYKMTRTLIFPSLTESFGLPLIEANQMRLPILAAELDFIRDVCTPAQTFDPHSPVSIARAVKRHLCLPEYPLHLRTPSEFLTELLAQNSITSTSQSFTSKNK